MDRRKDASFLIPRSTSSNMHIPRNTQMLKISKKVKGREGREKGEDEDTGIKSMA